MSFDEIIRFAIINIRSDTVKMSVFEVETGIRQGNGKAEPVVTQIKLLHAASEMSNLTEGMQPSQMLQPSAIGLTITKVAEMVGSTADYQPRAIELVGTGTALKAKNIDALTDEIYKATSLEMKSLTEDEESDIFYRGIVADFDDAVIYLAALNMRDGSTELTFGHKFRIDEQYCLPLDAVGLNEEFLKHDPPTGEELAALDARIKKALYDSDIVDVVPETLLVYIGGALDFVSRAGYKLEPSHFSPSHPHEIRLDDFICRSEEIGRLTKEQRRQFMPENPLWTDGAVAGNLIAQNIAEYLKLRKILPSNKNLNDGLLLRLLDEEGLSFDAS